MAITNDLQFRIAQDAINSLENIGIDTSSTDEPMTRWTRVRDAVRNHAKADPAPLWEAIAKDDQRAITKAATDYQVSQAIAAAAKADTGRENVFRAETLSVVKRLVIDAQDEARDQFNAAAEEYTSAFAAADNHPDPSTLIVSDGGAELWADLINAAQDMSRAADVIKRGAEFGHKVNDEDSGLGDIVPFVTGIDDIQAVSRAKSTTWLDGQQHAPHRQWAHMLIAGGTLHAGDLTEQREEVTRLIEQAQAGRKQKMLPDMISDEDKALKRAMKSARKAGRA